MQDGKPVVVRWQGFWFLGRENERGAVQLDIENFAKLSEAIQWADKFSPLVRFKILGYMDLTTEQIERLQDIAAERKMPVRVGVHALREGGLWRWEGRWKKRKRVLTDKGKAFIEEIASAG